MSWKVENAGKPFRVVVTKDLPGTRWRSLLAGAGCEIHICEHRHVLSSDEIRGAIAERCDGVIGQLTEQWGESLFKALAKAGGRVYSNYAVGYDNVEVSSATKHGIAVGNTPGVLTETTAEMAMALTFAAARRVPESEVFLRRGCFEGWLPDLFLGKRLFGGTLGIVGAGRIGSAYARMLAPGLCMNVLYHSPDRELALESYFRELGPVVSRHGKAPISCSRAESLQDLLRRSDVVSLHVPLNESTRHLLDRAALALMKSDAILVNTSRGPVIDEAALVEHLRLNPEFRVGLDVFENEPALAPGLGEMPNAVLVPHLGSATTWTREGMAILAAANVAGRLRGDPLADPLDVDEFLGDAPARKTPSIINAEVLQNPGL